MKGWQNCAAFLSSTAVIFFCFLILFPNTGPDPGAPETQTILVNKNTRRPLIVSVQINPNETPYCTLAKQSWKKYAAAHGYALNWITQRNQGHSPKIQKYVEVLERMNKMPENNLILLTDCDVVVTNSSIRMETVWDTEAKADTSILLAKDPAWQSKGIPINSGMIMMKNNAWTRRLFEEIIVHGPVHGNWTQWNLLDQPILTKLLVQKGELAFTHRKCCLLCYNCVPSTTMSLPGTHLGIVKDRAMNSIKRSIPFFSQSDARELEWHQGDWTAHITGSSRLRRLGLVKETLAMLA